MAGVRKKPLSNGKYQGWFINLHGKRKFFTGTHNRRETLRMAERLEDDHLQYAVGYRPLPSMTDINGSESFEATRQEYLDWGNAQGGRLGHPWSPVHARMRTRHLTFWQAELKLNLMEDLNGCLLKVERVMRALQTQGLSGKTINNHIETLNAFCQWCITRDLLADNPLKRLRKLNATPQIPRRVLTISEIKKVLQACNEHQRLLMETAFLSGLRVKELRSLAQHHLNVKRSGLLLEAHWTKNRKSGFQPLPKNLTKTLSRFVKQDGANQVYAKYYTDESRPAELPDHPLLFVPTHSARSLDRILKRVGIPKKTDQGKIDFHACRGAYITMLIESGASLKEVQTLARHSDLRLTTEIYAKVREGRLNEAVETIAHLSRIDASEA